MNMATFSEDDLSPEEKLLKVIQQKKSGVRTPPRLDVSALSTPAPAGTASVTGGTAAMPVPAPSSKPEPRTGPEAVTEVPAARGAGAKAVPPPLEQAAGRDAEREKSARAPAAEQKAAGPATAKRVAVAGVRSKAVEPASAKGAGASGVEPKTARPAAAETEDRKLKLQAQAARTRADPKTIETVAAAVHQEISRRSARTRTRDGEGSTLRIFNRALAAAAVLLFVVVVLELLAAKPVLPRASVLAGARPVFPGAIVPPPAESQVVGELSKHDLFSMTNKFPTNTPPIADALQEIIKYMAESVKLEGVSIAESEDQAFAAITEKGLTRYLRIGATVSIPVAGRIEKVTLDKILRTEAVFLYGNEKIPIKGAQ